MADQQPCDSCGTITADGAAYAYSYTWGKSTHPGLSNVSHHEWIEPRERGQSFLCRACATEHLIRLRWRTVGLGLVISLGAFLAGIVPLVFLVATNFLGRDLAYGDLSPLGELAIVGAGVALLGYLISWSLPYDEDKLTYRLGAYGWKIKRPELIESGLVPERRGDLELFGDGVKENTRPTDLEHLREHPTFQLQSRARIAGWVAALVPWYGAIYAIAVLVLIEVSQDRALWDMDPIGAAYGWWLTAAAVVLFNPLVGIGLPWIVLRVARAKINPRIPSVVAVLTVAVPLVALSLLRPDVSLGERFFFVGGGLVAGALALLSLILWYRWSNS